MPATVVAIDHVQLAMPAGAEDRARAFYVDLLGLHELPKPPVLAARGGCWFAVPGSQKLCGDVHLGVEAGFSAAHKAHPGLAVDDLTALVDQLAAAGVGFTPDTAIDALQRGYVEDPFGNRIELLQA